jgi:hypothetical protein
MSHLNIFYLLKQKILSKYKEHYPYYQGEVHQFGNKEIAQLLDLIEKDTNERVSEKWVYTHLKPKENNKLPRKDMLDIFSRWTGYAGWDEFVYLNQNVDAEENTPIKKKNNNAIIIMGAGFLIAMLAVVISFTVKAKNEVTVCFKDRYTQKSIDTDKFSLFLIENGNKKRLSLKGNCSTIKSDRKEIVVLVESPYYKKDTFTITMESAEGAMSFDLQPDDYAMMLRAYMNSDLKDWNKRKKQLEDILSDDAIIQEVMFEEIGVEFLNKEEFIAKVTTPTETVRQMEIIEIEYEGDKIISLKYIQK